MGRILAALAIVMFAVSGCTGNTTSAKSNSEDEKLREQAAGMIIAGFRGNDIESLSGAGAWVGSPSELCRFVASIDGRPEIPDIISSESVAAMTEYFDSQTFSLGWNDTKPTGEWTRTGTFSGTSALVKYFPDGECWVLITNTSTWRGPGLARYTEAMFKKCRELYGPLLPERNLFSAAPGSRIFFQLGVLPEIQSPSLPEYVLTSNSPDNTL